MNQLSKNLILKLNINLILQFKFFSKLDINKILIKILLIKTL